MLEAQRHMATASGSQEGEALVFVAQPRGPFAIHGGCPSLLEATILVTAGMIDLDNRATTGRSGDCSPSGGGIEAGRLRSA